jgi:hypothetical protein
MAPDPENGGPIVTGEPVSVDRLTAECPTHGTVPVRCPRCIGRQGGKRHKGTTWKRKKELEAVKMFDETTRRVLDLQPEVRMLQQMAQARKKLQNLGARMGWSKDEVELLFTELRLDGGMKYLRQLCDRMGMSPEERAEVCKDMQRTSFLALDTK